MPGRFGKLLKRWPLGLPGSRASPTGAGKVNPQETQKQTQMLRRSRKSRLAGQWIFEAAMGNGLPPSWVAEILSGYRFRSSASSRQAIASPHLFHSLTFLCYNFSIFYLKTILYSDATRPRRFQKKNNTFWTNGWRCRRSTLDHSTVHREIN